MNVTACGPRRDGSSGGGVSHLNSSSLSVRRVKIPFMSRIATRFLFVVCLSALFFSPFSSSSVDAQRGGAAEPAASAGPFGALRWRNLGPARGGRSLAASGRAARPNEYYFGATGGGLWKTTDGGTIWRPVTDGMIHSSSVGALAVGPSDPHLR